MGEPDLAAGQVADVVLGVLAEERLLLLEQGEHLVQDGRVGRVRVEAEAERRRRRTLPGRRRASTCGPTASRPTVSPSSRGRPAPCPGSTRSRSSTSSWARRTCCRGRTSGRSRPDPRLAMFVIREWSSGWMTPSADEAGDVGRGGVGQVVATALAVAADLGDLRVRIGELVVLDLDPVLLLEGRDRRVGDVLVPVVDVEILLRRRGGRRRSLARGGSRAGGRAGSRGRGRTSARRSRTGVGVAADEQAAIIGPRATAAPRVVIRSSSSRRVIRCSTRYRSSSRLRTISERSGSFVMPSPPCRPGDRRGRGPRSDARQGSPRSPRRGGERISGRVQSSRPPRS